MNYAEALKKVSAEKPKDNYMVIQMDFSYKDKLLLPYKTGVALLETLAQAEKLVEPYDKPKHIAELDRDTVSIKMMSHQEYARFKIGALLGLTPEEVLELSNPTPVAEPTNPDS